MHVTYTQYYWDLWYVQTSWPFYFGRTKTNPTKAIQPGPSWKLNSSLGVPLITSQAPVAPVQILASNVEMGKKSMAGKAFFWTMQINHECTWRKRKPPPRKNSWSDPRVVSRPAGVGSGPTPTSIRLHTWRKTDGICSAKKHQLHLIPSKLDHVFWPFQFFVGFRCMCFCLKHGGMRQDSSMNYIFEIQFNWFNINSTNIQSIII